MIMVFYLDNGLEAKDGSSKINILTYPRLVKEFFENLRRISGDITSSIKGIEIILTKAILRQILGVSSLGIMPERLPKRKIGLRYILDLDDIDGTGELIASTLLTDIRVLCHIIVRIFLSKTSRFDFVFKRELGFDVSFDSRYCFEPTKDDDDIDERGSRENEDPPAIWYGIELGV